MAARVTRTAAIAAGLILCAASPAVADHPGEVADLALEDLLAMEITSVAKQRQHPDEAAAAVFVIRSEDIRRSGATTLPELFRMVPGMEVAELPAGGAAVSARGFNGRFSNKLLILVDGRPIYLSSVSGVLWEQQLVPVESIERIEVVRGPGAAVWGANAMNGVINIITRHPVDTTGVGASAQADDEGGHRLYASAGGTLGANAAFRIYATRRETDDQTTVVDPMLGVVAFRDEFEGQQAGFRIDYEPSDRNAFTLQGDLSRGGQDTSAPAFGPAGAYVGSFEGANLLARWAHTGGPRRGFTVQGYFDQLSREEPILKADRQEFGFDLSHRFPAGERHQLVWGLTYRMTREELIGSPAFYFTPEDHREQWYGGFVQDDISVIPDRLNVSIGAKVEENPQTGLEVQPSIRAIWKDPSGWALWAAASRAVRTPSRLESDTVLDVRPFIVLLPTEADPEVVHAFELGWRGKLGERVKVDLAAYHNVYDDLLTTDIALGFYLGAPVLVGSVANLGEARATGLEAAVSAQITSSWSVALAANWADLEVDAAGFPLISIAGSYDAGYSPRSQASLRSSWNVTPTVELDVWLRWVDELEAAKVDSYTDLDVRMAWQATPRLELFARGENLLEASRIEIRQDVTLGREAPVERRLTLGVRGRF